MRKGRKSLIGVIVMVLFMCMISGCTNDETTSTTVTADVTTTSTLAKYTVGIIVNGSSYGSVDKTRILDVNEGTVISNDGNTLNIGDIRVTAIPIAATSEYIYELDSWENGDAVITSDLIITANFVRVESIVNKNIVFSYDSAKDTYCVTGYSGNPTDIVVGKWYNDGVNGKKIIREINVQAFKDCTSLVNVKVYDNVEVIGNGAFSGCSSLESVKISNKVRRIEERTFLGCSSLTSILIPSSVTNIGIHSFSVDNLETVYIDSETVATELGISSVAGNIHQAQTVYILDSITTVSPCLVDYFDQLPNIFFNGVVYRKYTRSV